MESSDCQECSICYETLAPEDELVDCEAGTRTSSSIESINVNGDETINSNGALPRVKVAGCEHFFCRPCMIRHCQHAISIRKIPISCPANASEDCKNTLQVQQVVDLIGPASPEWMEESAPQTWKKFQRYHQQHLDPSLVACSRCDELLDPTKSRASSGHHQNDLSCKFCGHSFCKEHGDAHPNVSCKSYKKKRDKTMVRKLKKLGKPCSHCGITIEKSMGCDHVVCGWCHDDMCYKCGTHLYLSGEMSRSCGKCKQSYIDHRYIGRYRLIVCLTLPLYLPICIAYVLLMAALAIASCGCFCCLGCGVVIDEDGFGREISLSELQPKPKLAARSILTMIFAPLLELMEVFNLDQALGFKSPDIQGTNTDINLSDDEDNEVGVTSKPSL